MGRTNPSFQKRQLERKKAEKRQEKARLKEERRRRLEEERSAASADGGDPDLAGIVPGPQPVADPYAEDGTAEDEEGAT